MALRAASCALLLAFGQATGPGPTDAASASQSWLDGDAASSLAALARLPASRERDFNQAVVLLYSGSAEAAERALATLRTRDAQWLPAVRWLARAQQKLARPEATDTAVALLKLPGATSGDQFWAGRFFAERKDLERARDAFSRAVASESDLYLAWSGLAEVEMALGHGEAARAARSRAEALCPANPAPAPTPAEPLPSGPLRYRARYLFLPLADVTLADGGLLVVQDRPARRLTLDARSVGAGRLFHIDSRFEAFVGRDGTLIGHRNLSNDSTGPRNQAVVDIDPATGEFRARRVRDGLLSYDVIPLPPQARPHDGLSLIEAARAVARTGGTQFVLRLADATWKGTLVRSVRAERISWQGRQVDTVCVEIGIGSRGAAGVQGRLQLWISADQRAIPYRARFAISVGSVSLELERPDASGASARD
jgi:tetratricopeptide (TPR) repeat protein